MLYLKKITKIKYFGVDHLYHLEVWNIDVGRLSDIPDMLTKFHKKTVKKFWVRLVTNDTSILYYDLAPKPLFNKLF